MKFDNLIKDQWNHHYEPTLRNADVETPLDWYNKADDGELEDIENPESTILGQEEALDTLFRMTTYRNQPFVFLGHNPEIQLNEYTDDVHADHQREHQKLYNIDGVDAKKYGDIIEPNWAGYLDGKADKKEDNTKVWSEKLGFLFQTISEYSNKIDLPKRPETFFQPDGEGSVGKFFDSFYYTNAFKFPTETGEGDSVLGNDVDEKFYHELLRDELQATSATVVFSFGKPAYNALRSELSIVDVGHEQPLNNNSDTTLISNVHGYLFEWKAADIYVLPCCHWTARQSYQNNSRAQRTKRSLEYLSDIGAI